MTLPVSLKKEVQNTIVKQIGYLILGVNLLLSPFASAEPTHLKVLSLQMDNDFLFGTDREYTGGIKVNYNNGHFKLNDWLIQPIESILGSFLSQNLTSSKQTQDQLEFSTEIYTIRQKKDGKKLEALTNTAWISISSKRFYQLHTRFELPAFYHLGMRLGWIGPSNMGEKIQNGFHQLIGNQPVEGWSKQPFDQPTLQISFEQQNLFYQNTPHTFNAYFTSWGELGFPRTDLYLGIGGYLHKNAHPIFYHNIANHIIDRRPNWGYFVFANMNISYDFYNLFRDGRPFTKDPSLIPELSPWRFESRLGMGIKFDSHSLYFTVTRWQQFYAEQPETAFHYASLAYSFAL